MVATWNVRVAKNDEAIHMARPKKTDTPDLTERINLTAGAIERLACPADKLQAFMRDTEAPGLRVRVTAAGAKSFVYEAKLNRQTIRRTIGDVKLWSIEQARTEARRMAVVLDGGQDPREIEREQQAQREAAMAQASAQAVTVGEAWAVYLEERRPFWGELHYRDHLDKAQPGGLPSKRRGHVGKKTTPGPLASLMPVRLRDLTPVTVERWAATEGKSRPASARLAWRLLTVFLTWCSEQPQYKAVLPAQNPAKTKKAREALGKAKVKTDVLTREQLPAWFAQVTQLPNRVQSAALQVMLLTGARPGEVIALKWEDINFQWKGISMRDKIEGAREIPLTPYVEQLLADLPRRNEWVFSSVRALSMDEKNVHRRTRKAELQGTKAPTGPTIATSASGRITEPNAPHTRACKAAGINGLTLHGLRRSFKSLTEWLEVPVGVVAQIQGHKPSATAEKHYTVRPLDLLRLHHERIEAWLLEQAGVKPAKPQESHKLRAIGT